MMPSVSVLALGNWGTALGNHLARKGFDVLGWALEDEIVQGINSKHQNPLYHSQVTLQRNFRATVELSEALEREWIVMVFPSEVLGEMIPKLKVSQNTTLVSAIKGLETNSLLTPLQFAEKQLASSARLAVISGPSFAKDVVAGKPCGIVAAANDEPTALEVAQLFSSDSMRVYTSTDPLGVELGGILKNVIALAAGVSDGLQLGESARAGIITRGLAEIMRLAVAMGAERETLFGLSGLGDLAMTSTSSLSRNHTVGLRLGEGQKLPRILAELGSVAEGVKTTPLVLALAEKFQVEMPITMHVAKLIAEELSPNELVRSLIMRPLKKEFDEIATEGSRER